MPVLPCSLHALIGCAPTDVALSEVLKGHEQGEPESIKAYPDVVYYNYGSIGVTLQYIPVSAYKPPRTATKRSDLNEALLELSTIDVYSDKFQDFPINLTYAPPTDPANADGTQGSTSARIDLKRETTGQDIVSKLGEPDRKGGGESKTIGVWLDYTGLGLLVEFSGTHGAHRWDKDLGAAKSAVGIFSFFEPGKEAGKSV